MSIAYKTEVHDDIGTTFQNVYTCPASTTAIIIGFNLSNVTGADVTTTVEFNDGSTIVSVEEDKVIPANSSIHLVDNQKFVLEAGDYVRVISSAVTSIDSIISVMEMS